MAKNDRIRVGLNFIFDESVTVPVYGLQLDNENKIVFNKDGTAVIKMLGGVKGGSTGIIQGDPLHVHTSDLAGPNQTAAMMGVSMTPMFPVYLDYYQKVGWFPSDCIRIYLGSSEFSG